MNSAIRKAQTDAKRAADRASRQFESNARAELAQFERRANAQIRHASQSPRPSISMPVAQERVLSSWADAAEADADLPNDLFLSHAWADRAASAKALYDALGRFGLKVWFSEVELKLGQSLGRQIDKALANCTAGLVLVTPAFLTAVEMGTWAERELGVLIGSGRVIPVLHEATFEQLKRVSPMLADRDGLSTAEDSFDTIAEKLAAAI